MHCARPGDSWAYEASTGTVGVTRSPALPSRVLPLAPPTSPDPPTALVLGPWATSRSRRSYAAACTHCRKIQLIRSIRQSRQQQEETSGLISVTRWGQFLMALDKRLGACG